MRGLNNREDGKCFYIFPVRFHISIFFYVKLGDSMKREESKTQEMKS